MQCRDSNGKGKGKGSVCQMRQEVRTMKSDTKSMEGKRVLAWLLKKDKPDAMGIEIRNIDKIIIASMFPIILSIVFLIRGII